MGTKFILGQEDGTNAGGNARGDSAVDLQTSRGASTQVASGNYAVISGGQNNTATGVQSFIGGGFQNSTTDSLATTVGGRQNTAGYASFMGGGQSNNASAFWGVCVGGQRNTSIGYGFVGGGLDNSITTGGYSNIVGGELNVVNTGAGTNAYSVISGGRSNSITSAYSTISGGQSNTASTNSHATIVGGFSNTASGQFSVSGGQGNTASGLWSTVFGYQNTVSGANGSFAAGQSNNVTGNFSAAFGAANTVSGERNFAAGISNSVSGTLGNATFGNANTVSSDLSSFATGRQNESFGYGFVSGYRGVTIGYASRVLSNNAFSTLASSQIREMIASRNALLTSAATTTLSLDGTGVTNLISTLYDANRMWHVTLKYVAVVTSITGTATGVTIGDIKTQTIELGMKRVITVSSLVGAGNFSTPQQDTSMSSASLIPSIVGNDLILTFTAPTFAGGGSVNCRVVAKVELVEVGY